MMSIKLHTILVAFAMLAGFIDPASGGQFKAGGTLFNVKTRAMTDMRFENLIRQQFDLSCGAAAMATILQYFYDDETSERQIVEAMFEIGDPEQIAEHGFSMLELKRYAESRGFVSQGYRISEVRDLGNLKVPVITLINTRGYNHFVVLKRVHGEQVIIADPAFGNTLKTLDQFEIEWGNVILVVLSRDLNGNQQFAQDFSVKAPMSEVQLLINRSSPPLSRSAGEF